MSNSIVQVSIKLSSSLCWQVSSLSLSLSNFRGWDILGLVLGRRRLKATGVMMWWFHLPYNYPPEDPAFLGARACFYGHGPCSGSSWKLFIADVSTIWSLAVAVRWWNHAVFKSFQIAKASRYHQSMHGQVYGCDIPCDANPRKRRRALELPFWRQKHSRMTCGLISVWPVWPTQRRRWETPNKQTMTCRNVVGWCMM